MTSRTRVTSGLTSRFYGMAQIDVTSSEVTKISKECLVHIHACDGYTTSLCTDLALAEFAPLSRKVLLAKL